MARGGAVVFVAGGHGTATLVIGSGISSLVKVAAYFGSEVTYFEVPPARDVEVSDARDSTAAGSAPPDAREARAGLPFDDGQFDSVVLTGVLERAGGVHLNGRRRAPVELLTQCERVLKPGGLLMAIAENRFGITNLGGRRHPVLNRPFLQVLPRTLVGLLSTTAARAFLQHRALSRKELSSLCRRAGFQPQDWRALWPSAESWTKIAPAARPPDRGLYSNTRSLKVGAANLAVKGLSLVRLQGAIPPDYLLVARRAAGAERDPLPLSLFESILRTIEAATGAALSREVTLVGLTNSSTVSLISGGYFIKVPLSPASLDAVAREARASECLVDHPIAAHTPGRVVLASAGMVTFSFCTAVARASNLTGPVDDAATSLERVLDDMSAGARDLRLGETDFWARITSPATRAHLNALGGTVVLSHVEHRLSDRRVYAGVGHGDFHSGNILYGNGRLFVIDWDRFESRSPLFLDLVDLIGSVVLRRAHFPLDNREVAVCRFILAADPAGLSLRSRLERYRGELTTPEMLLLYLLHRISWNCHNRAVGVYGAAVRRGFDERITYCKELVSIIAADRRSRYASGGPGAARGGTAEPPAASGASSA